MNTPEHPAGRLVPTRTARMWHIGHREVGIGQSLCGIDARPPGVDYPVYSDICQRCERVYVREVAR